MDKKQEIYNKLAGVVKESRVLLTRYDLIGYCIGYYGSIDSLIFEVINDLYKNELIKA